MLLNISLIFFGIDFGIFPFIKFIFDEREYFKIFIPIGENRTSKSLNPNL